MNTQFYLSSGIRFKDLLDGMHNVCDFVVKPNSASHGEEPTKRSEFIEDGFSGSLMLENLNGRYTLSIGGWSLNDKDKLLRLRWNPNKDSLIHCFNVSLHGYTIIPERHYNWKESKLIAPFYYNLCKRIFIMMKCDEANGIYETGSVLFNWVRKSNFQTVIQEYEYGKEITEDVGYSWNWLKIFPTEQVFPEIAAEYEAKYKEMLDYRMDW